MAEDWYIERADGHVEGPIAEREVAADLLRRAITDEDRVRQGEDGEWCEAARARQVFQRLSETGWYIRHRGEVFGPFTDARLLELDRGGEIHSRAFLRQGSGPWKPAESLLANWRGQRVPRSKSTGESAPSKWSVAPLRHVTFALEASTTWNCQTHERLLLHEVGKQVVEVRRTCGARVGRLKAADVQLVQTNADRGISHLALFVENDRIAVVICQPGTEAAMCQAYINEHFVGPELTIESDNGPR